MADLVAHEADAYGPMSRVEAQRYAARTGADLDDQGMGGVTVAVVALTATDHRRHARPD